MNPIPSFSITADKLGHRFGKHVALSNLEFHITPNEHVVIRGNNGSGKSTLARILAGHLSCTDGLVTWTDLNSVTVSEDDVSLTTMFSGPSSTLHPALTIREILSFHETFRNWWPGFEPFIWLKQGGLMNSLDTPFAQLSSGMKQRVELTLALGTECGLLVLDEPCANLDAHGIEWYREQLEWVNEKTTLCICSNDRAEDHLEPSQVITL
ncbi:MAG: ABC transporter ATP-binding protein [Flavobacteriales bacterium]